VCLGYRRRAAAFAQRRDGGGKVSVVRGRHRPPILFYPSGDLPRHRREEVFKPLTFLDNANALTSKSRASGGEYTGREGMGEDPARKYQGSGKWVSAALPP